jgi:nucleoside phosphorylase
VEAVLHVGIAGARGLAPGTLVVGTEAVYADLSAGWPVVDRVEADPALLAAVRAALPAAAPQPIHTAASVGGASNSSLQGSLVEAMEGFGVLRAAARAGVPAVEVRAVSNEIGEEDRSKWAIDAALTALEGAVPLLVDALGRV